MGQDWDLINVDKRARLRNRQAINFWEYLIYTPTEQLVGLLRRLHWITVRIPSQHIQTSKIRSAQRILFMRLPQEIIDRIVHFVACNSPRGSEDLICLSLTCAYMFRLLAAAVQDALRQDLGPWAGDRLVFYGDHAWSEPEYIDTASEKIALEANPYSNPTVHRCGIDKVGESKHSERHVLPSEQLGVYGMLSRNVEERLGGERANLKRFRRLKRFLTQCPAKIRGGNMSPVLRNLNTKEYVREEVLAQSDYAYSLGEIVMIYTIWTDGS